MIRRIALCVLFLAFRTFDASAQTKIVLQRAGSGEGPELLAAALSGPHGVVPPAAGQLVIPKDSTYSQTLIVLGRTVVVEGTVRGDLIVVDGDLYMHPGGQIVGSAVAIGGGVYESALAKTGKVLAFREFAYDIAPIPGGFSLTYHEIDQVAEAPMFQPLGLRGLLVPSYDRTNGLSLPAGISINASSVAVHIAPQLTYRSQLGRVDPSVHAWTSFSRTFAVTADLGRSTFSNDSWIRSDLLNSLHVITVGNDTRNYFRATRGEAKLNWAADTSTSVLSGYFGVRGEHALSVRPDVDATGGPWVFHGRRDVDDMLRPNPQIQNGTTYSVIFGGKGEWLVETIATKAGLDLEVGKTSFDSIAGATRPIDRSFGQATFDGSIDFPTFGLQTLHLDGHVVATTRGATPRQRWAYLGGTGTLTPLDILALGGDQLLYLDGRYNIPMSRIQTAVGSPVVTLRDAIGGADIGRAPSLHQAIGLRLSLATAYVEFMADPATRAHRFGFGLSLQR